MELKQVEVFKFELDGEQFSANIIACEEGGYFAHVVGCDGCATQAETLEEVKADVQKALADWLGSMEEDLPVYEDWRKEYAKREK